MSIRLDAVEIGGDGEGWWGEWSIRSKTGIMESKMGDSMWGIDNGKRS